MTPPAPKCLLCNCEKTMKVDMTALAKGYGGALSPVHNQLCRAQIKSYERALAEGGPLLVACTQEAPLFTEIADETPGAGSVQFVNIRETAGWSAQAGDAAPKMAALMAGAAFAPVPARLKSIESDGLCLVYGAGQPAVEAAKLLSARLSVTLVLSGDTDVILPPTGEIPVYCGQIASASGSFGGFDMVVDGYAPMQPASRRGPEFGTPRDGARTRCDLILDLSGGTALFTGARHRDGYKSVDPRDPLAVMRAVLDLSDMVGSYEKPIYVDYVAETCAHSRSTKTGCTACLDACPAGAIVSLGDAGISIDAGICGGCGACAAGCPTGSISYQYPTRADTIARVQTMLAAFTAAGGKRAPVLLVHDADGAEVLNALARFGDGLPAHVIPLEVHKPTLFGHVEMAAALAGGAAAVMLLLAPADQDELPALAAQIALMNQILAGLGDTGGARVSAELTSDPDALAAALAGLQLRKARATARFAPQGSKRDVARMALAALNVDHVADPVPLGPGAPYGRVEINAGACTLCMACTSACPAGAIIDTPGEPRLRFVEAACVQCGLCTTTCPETALTLVPQLNLAPDAMAPVTLHEEAPFECVECGKPFATGSTIRRIKEQLAGKHAMFATDARARLIEMCDDCKIEAQANSSEDPFAMGTRPKVRTTEDYLDAREGKSRDGLSIADFLMDDD